MAVNGWLIGRVRRDYSNDWSVLALHKALTPFLHLSREAGSCRIFCCLVEGTSSPRAQRTSRKHDEVEVVIPIKCITWRWARNPRIVIMVPIKNGIRGWFRTLNCNLTSS